MQSAMAAHLSERLGERCVITNVTRNDVISSSITRTFHRAHVRTASGRDLHLHVRLASWRHRQRDANRLDAYLSDRGLPTPRFFGGVRSEGQIATIWEYCPGSSHRSYKHLSRNHIHALVRSMALISAQTGDVRQHADVPFGMRWIHPIADQIEKLTGEIEGLQGHQGRIDHLRSGEDAVIQRAGAQNTWVLTHNDLVARNVVAMEDQSVRLLDWDSASIAPPGASLRALSYPNTPRKGKEIAELYMQEMRNHGVSAAVDDVHFMMQAQQVFWCLSTGVQRRTLDRLTKGLNLFESLFPAAASPPSASFSPASTSFMTSIPAQTLPDGYPKPAPDSLKALVKECMDRKGRGRLYSTIPHPDFAHLPAGRGGNRFELIKPHLSPDGGTALDIGAHFATFSHWLEDAGYKVTAVEQSPLYAQVAREVRDLTGKTFEVIEDSIFDLPTLNYDVVLALNIFHHFLKTERKFQAFEALLARLNCDMMFFESHVFDEAQMSDAHRNMNPQEFAQFIAERTGLTDIQPIGHDRKRTVFKLARPK